MTSILSKTWSQDFIKQQLLIMKYSSETKLKTLETEQVLK